MKTLEELDEADSVEIGSGYLMCLVEVYAQDSKTSSDRKIFGLVVSNLHCWIVLAASYDKGTYACKLGYSTFLRKKSTVGIYHTPLFKVITNWLAWWADSKFEVNAHSHTFISLQSLVSSPMVHDCPRKPLTSIEFDSSLTLCKLHSVT